MRAPIEFETRSQPTTAPGVRWIDSNEGRSPQSLHETQMGAGSPARERTHSLTVEVLGRAEGRIGDVQRYCELKRRKARVAVSPADSVKLILQPVDPQSLAPDGMSRWKGPKPIGSSDQRHALLAQVKSKKPKGLLSASSAGPDLTPPPAASPAAATTLPHPPDTTVPASRRPESYAHQLARRTLR